MKSSEQKRYWIIDIEDFAEVFEHSDLSIGIGNFDGLHLGHQKLLQKVLEDSQTLNSKPYLLSFEPHPDVFFGRCKTDDRPLLHITDRSQAAEELGLSGVVYIKFTQTLADLKGREFFQKLNKKQKIRSISVGSDFRFGNMRSSDSQELTKICAENDIQLNIISLLSENENRISSTIIRDLIYDIGDVQKAQKLLGRAYSISGSIVSDYRIGTQIGFPTLNLDFIPQMLPKNGVYVGYVALENYFPDKSFPIIHPQYKSMLASVFNIGLRPTVHEDQKKPSIEAHCLFGLGKQENCVGKRARFYLTQRLRDEKKFQSLEELKKQISLDVKVAKEILNIS